MPRKIAAKAGNSGAEAAFVRLFSEAFGPEKGQFVYTQYPFTDIYGKHRTIDYALQTEDGKIAIEVDGNTWHQPGIIGEEKYHDDLLKQNSMVYEGWHVYRWTSRQIEKTPDRVQDELITFLGSSPLLSYIEEELPHQEGQSFSLMEHQKEALANLSAMRENHETIALLYHATGTGKTTTAVMDAKSVGKPVLFLAHTRELIAQAMETFRKLWPEVNCGRYGDGEKHPDAFVVCGTVQSVSAHLEDFPPDRFGYLVIDECHHGTADSYKKILSWFKPAFTLGLTATPERTDGEDLLKIFQKEAHRLDLKTAVELGRLSPVRCIRIETNIDMNDVRINGFRYNSQDLDSLIRVPDRNRLIVDTWLEYVTTQPTVVFCASVRHAEEIATIFRERGVDARSVSGSMNPAERKAVLAGYEKGEIPVLCACDLLNEGWDSPHTSVLFMARPTMSKTVYMQQLGRGMRKAPGKDSLMVFDFVDNANLWNTPYTLHRLLGKGEYRPGQLVLAEKNTLQWDADMFAKGERPEALIDYPINITDFKQVDLFNWQDQAKDMISQIEFTRRVSAQSETVERYIKDGRIVPDMEVPIGSGRSFRYFNPEKVQVYADRFGWEVITAANMKDMFLEMVRKMDMSYSYKPVFLLSFFDHADENGIARLDDVVSGFSEYYENRHRAGLPAEKKRCIFTRDPFEFTDKEVERLVLSNPFKRFEDMRFIVHTRHLGTIQLDKAIRKRLTEDDIKEIRMICHQSLRRYFG